MKMGGVKCTMNRIDITEHILDEMEKKNISTRELSERSGLTKRYIDYLKKGEKQVMSIDIADRLLKALGLSVTIGKNADLSIRKMNE